MKKIIMGIVILTACTAGYLSYDLWQFTNQTRNATLVNSIYSWKDEKGVYHFSGTKPDAVTDFTVSDAYQYRPLPIVYRIRDMVFPAMAGLSKLVAENDDDGNKKPQRHQPSSSKNSVKIFTTERCGYCTKAKDYFSGKGIAYTEYDIETSASARSEFQSHQGRGVPLIIINDNKIVGFNKQAIDMYLR